MRSTRLLLVMLMACSSNKDMTNPVDAPPHVSIDAPGPDSSHQSSACPDTQASYPGTLFNAKAVNGNPNNPQAHFLELVADVDTAPSPDRLLVVAFYSLGVQTGTFTLPTTLWAVTLCTDFSGAGCTSTIEAKAGTLKIDSVTGGLAGSLTGATFANTAKTCSTSVGNVTFNVTLP